MLHASTIATSPAVAPSGFRSVITSPWLYGYIGLYAVTLALMNRLHGFDPTFPLVLAAVLGCGLSALAWLATKGLQPLPFSVRAPRSEFVFTLSYLLVVVAFITWGLTLLQRLFPSEPSHTIAVTAAKLLVFVAIPASVLCSSFGYRLSDLFPSTLGGRRHIRAAFIMCIVVALLNAVFGRAVRDLSGAHLSATTLLWGVPLAFLWAALEAGLVEEFFFRELLQSRLAAFFRSEVAAVVVMALLFGLAHAPGYYLRGAQSMEGLGAHPSALMAFGYAIVVTSLFGLVFGVLWARTRNLWLVVLVHAATDWLPGIVPFVHAWRHH